MKKKWNRPLSPVSQISLQHIMIVFLFWRVTKLVSLTFKSAIFFADMYEIPQQLDVNLIGATDVFPIPYMYHD